MEKIVKENLIEGVGDKYLQNKYHIPDEFSSFDKKFKSRMLNDQLFHIEEDWEIIKNPSSLTYFGEAVRGVIVSNGDFYLELFENGTIHNDILKILFKKGILSGEFKKNWTSKLPKESQFLTVQRYKDSQYIAIGESNKLIYDEDDYLEKRFEYEDFLNRAKIKCPNISFINKLVGTKYLKTSNGSSHKMNESYT